MLQLLGRRSGAAASVATVAQLSSSFQHRPPGGGVGGGHQPPATGVTGPDNLHDDDSAAAAVNRDAPKLPEAFQLKLAAAKERLRWRTPYGERHGEWYTKFKVFGTSRNEADNDVIAFLQQPLDFSLKARREKRERKRVEDERFMQQFVAERHQMLGNDLAAAHFLVHRGGSVKFTNSPHWIRPADDAENARGTGAAYSQLPTRYDPGWRLEACRCDGLELYYEGLENLRRLQHLKFLSFHQVRTFDDWCLDRVSGSEFSALEVLDVSGTAVTERGLGALYRVPTLRMLVVDNAQASRTFELTVAMLEELMPELRVVNAAAVH